MDILGARNDKLLITDLPCYNHKMLISVENVWSSVRDAESCITDAFEKTFTCLIESCSNDSESKAHVGIRDTMENAVTLLDTASHFVQNAITNSKRCVHNMRLDLSNIT